MLDETDPDLKQIDGIIYSLVMDFSTKEAVNAHVSALEKVQQEFLPRSVLPNHLLHCEWTIEPAVLQEAIKQKGLEGILIAEDERQVFEV